MTQEQDKYLVEKYPLIFMDRYGDMKKTAMVWGFEHGSGWFHIIDKLCSCIQNYIDNNKKPQIVATQVKEKFGSLRFYFSGGDNLIDGMVWMAEHLSYYSCEDCGTTNKVGHTKGWIYTLCEECSIERNLQNWSLDER